MRRVISTDPNGSRVLRSRVLLVSIDGRNVRLSRESLCLYGIP